MRPVRVPKVSTALYRRYRPDTFADVIGQEHVTVPLMRALASGRINHAYLFSGPRGCGKTTSARILARCLNCEKGPTGSPCGECDSCVALARGGAGSIDVIEIDAASHGGVDDARELRERAAFAPAESRFKVYIIDEAHMVTPQGFNALLKIVEEPPEHVKFIFATTEPEKVIGTIRSRTHHYPFRLVPPARLHDYLEHLCRSEGVDVEPGVLSFVVRAGGGSVRDSLSVLDQLMAGSDQRGLTYDGAAALLGFTDAELLDATVTAFAAGDGASVFSQIDRVIETGHDPRRFVEDLLERFRDLIVLSAVPDAGASVLRGVPSDQIDRMRVQASGFGPGALSRAADVVNAGLTEMTGATAPRLQLELIAARVLLPGAAGEQGYAARLDRIERRLDVAGAPSTGMPSGPNVAPPPSTRGTQQDSGQGESGPVAGGAPGPQASGDAGSTAGRPDAGPHGESPRPDQHRRDGRAPSQPGVDDRGPRTTGDERQPSGHEDRDVTRQGPVERGPQASGSTGAAGGPAMSEQRPGNSPGGAPGRRPGGARPAIVMGSPTSAEPLGDANDTGPRGPGGLDVAALRRSWPDVLARIFTLKRTTWTFLSEHAQISSYDGQRLVLSIGTVGLANTFRNGVHPEIVRQALIDVLGVDARIDAIAAPAGGSAAGAPGSAGTSGVDHGGRGVDRRSSSGSGDSIADGTSGQGRDSRSDSVPPSSPGRGAAGPGTGRPNNATALRPEGSGPQGSRPSGPTARADSSFGPTTPGRDGGPGDRYGADLAARDWSDGGSGWGSGPSSGAPTWATTPGDATTSASTRADDGRAVSTATTSTAATGDTDDGSAATDATATATTRASDGGSVDEEDLISDDDEDLADLGEVGQPVIERVLGGTVIWRETPDA